MPAKLPPLNKIPFFKDKKHNVLLKVAPFYGSTQNILLN